MQIVGFGVDDKTSGGKAKISWLMKDQLNTTHSMNPTNISTDGWLASEMRSWLKETVLPTLDFDIRSHIVEVNKTYLDYTTNSTLSSSDDIWLPSMRELFGVGTSIVKYENNGVMYTSFFANAESRIKKRLGNASFYVSRSTNMFNDGYFSGTSASGQSTSTAARDQAGVVFGFCTD